MRYLLAALILISIFILKQNKPVERHQASESIQRQSAEGSSPIKRFRLSIPNGNFVLLARKLEPTEDLILIPNFGKNMRSREVFESNDCNFLANGPFYTEDDSPLGLFYLKGKLLGKEIKSRFLNGFFWKTPVGNWEIGTNPPSNLSRVELAIQSGPYFESSQKYLKMEETKARRTLVAENYNNEIFFLFLFDEDDSLSGPALNELPQILNHTLLVENLSLSRMVNLDGGSTSAYLQAGQDSFSEFKKSGSFFCIKNRQKN